MHSTFTAPQRLSLAQRWLLIFALFLPALIFLRTLRYDFVYDDKFLILQNPSVQSLADWKQIFHQPMWAFADSKATVPYYRPLLILLFAVEHSFFGYNPLPWHLINLLLHIGTVFLVFWVGRLVFQNDSTAILAALFFGVYPVTSEVASWVAACNESLLAIAFLVSFGGFLEAARTRHPLPWRVLSVAMLACALLVKELAIILPVLMFYWAALDLHEDEAAVDGIKSRFTRALLLTVPYAIVVLAVLMVRRSVVHGSLIAGSMAERLSYLGALAGFSVSKFLWPFRFAIYYPVAQRSIAATVFTVIAGIACLVAAWRSRRLTFLLLWITLTILPAININDPQILLQTRYLYLAAIAVCWGLGWLLAALPAEAWSTRLLVVVLLCIFAVSSYRNSGYWADDFRLADRGREMAPSNPRALFGYADALAAQNRYADALEVVQQARASAGNGWRSDFQAATYEFILHRLPDAAASVDDAELHLEPGFPRQRIQTLELKSRILLASGDLTGAESLLRKTLSEDPANQQLRADLISCLRRQGRNSDADRETQIEK